MSFGLTFARLVATSGALLMGTLTASAQDTITLRGIAPYPSDNYLGQPLVIFGEILEQKSGGKLKVKFLGADEVVPPLEQFDAVRNGTVDIALGVASYYTGSVPEASSIQLDRDKMPEELRRNGYIDLMKEIASGQGERGLHRQCVRSARWRIPAVFGKENRDAR